MAANSYRTEDGIIKAARAAKLPRWMYDTPEAWKALIRLLDQHCGPNCSEWNEAVLACATKYDQCRYMDTSEIYDALMSLKRSNATRGNK